MEIKVKYRKPIILKSCSIFEVQPVVKNAWNYGVSTFNKTLSRGTNTAREFGYITFVKDGQV